MTATLPLTHRPLTRLFAGLDVMASSERAAEHHLALTATAAREAGALDITTATHQASAFSTPHVSMSISMLTGLTPARMLELLADLLAVEDGAPGSVTLADAGVGLPALQTCASAAGNAHRRRSSGRVVEFAGSGSLTGTVTLEQILATAIDRIETPDGETPETGSLVLTRNFLRPRWHAGDLVLQVQSIDVHTWAPLEQPNPTPCCDAHR